MKLGIIGLGVQGYWQTVFALDTKDISEVYCFSRSQSKFSNFKNRIIERFPSVQIIWCNSGEEVVQKSDLILACTNASNPVFKYPKDTIGKRFISVGSFTPQMQELPNEVYQNSDKIVIDSLSAKTEVGDIINAIDNQWIKEENIISLVDLVSGQIEIRSTDHVVFKSVGMAGFDLSLAIAIFEKLNSSIDN